MQELSDGRVAAFVDVHASTKSGSFFIDFAHYQRLRLLLGHSRDTVLICVEAAQDQPCRIPAHVEVCIAYKARRFRYVSWIFETIRQLVKFSSTVRHSSSVIVMQTSSPLSYAGTALAILFKKPLVSILIGRASRSYDNVDASQPIARAIKGAISRRFEELVVRHSATLFAAAALARQFSTAIPFSTSGLTRDDFVRPVPHDREHRIEWLYVGAVNREKGVDTLLEALAIARRHDSRHVAKLVGRVDERFEAELKETIVRLRLDGHVEITGAVPRNKVRHYLQRADVFVFLSLHEGMPRAPLEAMAAGLPCVVTATGAEIYVVNDSNGVIVPVSAPSRVVEAVSLIVSDAQRLHRFSQEATASAQRFTYDLSLRDFQAALQTRFPRLTTVDSWGPES